MKSVTCLIVGLATLIVVGCGGPPPTSEYAGDTPVKMVRDLNEGAGFSIEHPLEWAFVEAPPGAEGGAFIVGYALSTLSPNTGVVIVIRRNVERFENLNGVQDWVKSLVPPTRKETQVRDAARRIGDEETLEREYTWEAEGTDGTGAVLMHCLDNYRLHEGIGFAISFCVEDTEFGRVKPTFDRMIESFEYLE